MNKCSFCGISYLVMHEIEDLKNQIKKLQEQNNLLLQKSKLEEESGQNTIIQAENLARMNKEMHLLNEKHLLKEEQLQQENDKLASANQSLTDKMESIQQILKLRDDLIQKQGARIDSMQLEHKQQVDKLNEEIKQQIDELLVQQKAKEQLLSQFSNAQDEIRKMQQTISDFQSDNNILKLQIENLSSNNQRSTDSAKELNQCIENLRQQVADLNIELSTVKQLNDSQATSIAELTIGKNELLGQVDSMVAKLENERDLYFRLEKTYKQKQMKLKQVIQDISNLQQQCLPLLEWVKSQVTVDCETINAQVSKMLAFSMIQSVKLEETQAQLQYQKNQVTKINGELNEVSKFLSQKDIAIEQLKDQILQLTSRLSIANQSGSEQIDSLNKTIGELNAQIEALQKESLLFQSSNDQKQSENDKLKQQINDLEDNKKELLLKIQGLQKYEELNQTLSTQMKADAAEKQKLSDDLKSAVKQIQALEKQIHETEVIICNQDQKIQDLQHQLRNTNLPDVKTTELLEENEKLKQKIAILQQTVFRECKERNELMRSLQSLREQVAKK